jgi:hypothetical protein
MSVEMLDCQCRMLWILVIDERVSSFNNYFLNAAYLREMCPQIFLVCVRGIPCHVKLSKVLVFG